MNNTIANSTSCKILKAGDLETQYLVDLLDRYELNFYDVMDVVECHFGEGYRLDFNIIVYEILSEIAHRFLNENPELSESNLDDFHVCGNGIDTRIYFEDDKVQSKFEDYF